MPEKDLKIICITPMKNESWILDKFLSATSLWADHIILADQKSTDNSVEIARKYQKAIVIKNETDYNEFERTKILLKEARKIEGKKIIFALDVDEFFTANMFNSPEWLTIRNAQAGTIFLFDRINLTPSLDQYFGKLKMALGLMDDEETSIESTSTAIIHNIRLPWPKNAEQIYCRDIKVLHYDYVVPERTLSKLRWYQCFERIKFDHSDKYLLYKYTTFNKIDDFLNSVKLFPVLDKWLENYQEKKVDLTSTKVPTLWWDDEVLNMINEHGINKFKNLAAGSVDWRTKAKEKGFSNVDNFVLKRSLLFRLTRYLKIKLFP